MQNFSFLACLEVARLVRLGKASKKKNVKLGLLAEVRGGRGPSRFWGPNLLLGQLSNA